jgi:hypothetical protein
MSLTYTLTATESPLSTPDAPLYTVTTVVVDDTGATVLEGTIDVAAPDQAAALAYGDQVYMTDLVRNIPELAPLNGQLHWQLGQ